jgi:hypothetical protein
MTIDDFLYEREQLNTKMGKLSRLKGLVYNSHIYPLSIDGQSFSSFGYKPSKAIIDAMEQEIIASIKESQTKLKDLESRLVIKD